MIRDSSWPKGIECGGRERDGKASAGVAEEGIFSYSWFTVCLAHERLLVIIFHTNIGGGWGNEQESS